MVAAGFDGKRQIIDHAAGIARAGNHAIALNGGNVAARIRVGNFFGVLSQYFGSAIVCRYVFGLGEVVEVVVFQALGFGSAAAHAPPELADVFYLLGSPILILIVYLKSFLIDKITI